MIPTGQHGTHCWPSVRPAAYLPSRPEIISSTKLQRPKSCCRVSSHDCHVRVAERVVDCQCAMGALCGALLLRREEARLGGWLRKGSGRWPQTRFGSYV